MFTTATMETKRLLLRPPDNGDLESFFALRSNTRVNLYIRREPPKTLEDVQVWLNSIMDGMNKGNSHNWCLVDKKDTKVVGSICLWSFSEDRKTAEVGYDLLPEYHGKGLMREALEQVLSFGFSKVGLSTVTAFTSHLNGPSRKLLTAHNFLLQRGRKDEDNADNVIYALSRHTWLCVQASRRLEYLLDTVPALLETIDAEEFGRSPAPGKWSKKQIIGHLIDSAANNHQRFIRGQFEDEPHISYDQEQWNRAGQYSSLPGTHILNMWETCNRHILLLMQQVDPKLLDRKVNTGDRTMTLSEIYEDYVAHLEHHLRQVVDY
jgi:RimJ/RimL family protein N-acetyltransferase